MSIENLNKRLKSIHNSKKESKVKYLYNLLQYKELYFIAFQNIYSKTKWCRYNSNTKPILDEFNKLEIEELIDKIKNKNYKPSSIKKIIISESNDNIKYLQTQTINDKLIQECIRIILSAIYESNFSDLSNGARPNRSCHTALNSIIDNFNETKWFINLDIKGCLNNINHKILINILREKINDEKFIYIIKLFLDSGYLEDWKYNNYYSETPQGGILNPILSNIYLDKIDKYIESIIEKINKSNGIIKSVKSTNIKTPTINYIKTSNNNCVDLIKNDTRILDDLVFKEIININNKMKGYRNDTLEYNKLYSKIYSKSLELEKKYIFTSKQIRELSNYYEYENIINNKSEFQKIMYVRYLDTFILGFIGPKIKAQQYFNMIKQFIEKNLNLNINKKSKIIHSKDGIRFLGYDINYISQPNTSNSNKNNFIKFKIPTEKIIQFVKDKKYGSYIDNKSEHKAYLINYTTYEIIKQYNFELQELTEYYKYASNINHIIGRAQWLCHYSLVKTLGNKYKRSVAKIFKDKILLIEPGTKDWYIEHPKTGKKVKIFKIKNANPVCLL